MRTFSSLTICVALCKKIVHPRVAMVQLLGNVSEAQLLGAFVFARFNFHPSESVKVVSNGQEVYLQNLQLRVSSLYTTVCFFTTYP